MILPAIELQPGAQVAVSQGAVLSGNQGSTATAGDIQPSFLAAFGKSLQESGAAQRQENATGLEAGQAASEAATKNLVSDVLAANITGAKAAGEESESGEPKEARGNLADAGTGTESGTSVGKTAKGSSSLVAEGNSNLRAKGGEKTVDEAKTDRVAGAGLGVKVAGTSDLLKAEQVYGSGLGEEVATKTAELAGAGNASSVASGTDLAGLETVGAKGAKTATVADAQSDLEIEALATAGRAGLDVSAAASGVAAVQSGDRDKAQVGSGTAHPSAAKPVAVKAASAVTGAKTGVKVQGGKGLAGALAGALTVAELSGQVDAGKIGVLASGAGVSDGQTLASSKTGGQAVGVTVTVQPGVVPPVPVVPEFRGSLLGDAGEIRKVPRVNGTIASATSSTAAAGAAKTGQASELQDAGTAKPATKLESATVPVAAAAVAAPIHAAKDITSVATTANTENHILPSTAAPNLISGHVGTAVRSGSQAVPKAAARAAGETGVAGRAAAANEDKAIVGRGTAIEAARQTVDGTRGRGPLQQTEIGEVDGSRQGTTSQQALRGDLNVSGNSTDSASSAPASNTAVNSESQAVVSTGGVHAPSVPVAAAIAAVPGSSGTPAGAHPVAVAGQELTGGVSAVRGASSTLSSSGSPGGVGGTGRADVAATTEPHRTLLATPTTLEVGVPNGTEGWLRIRAQVGDQGQVNASLAAGSSAGQEMLHRELPALNAFLHSEQLPVTAAVSERSFTAAGGGVADDAGRAMSANAGLTQGGTAHQGTAGQPDDSGQRVVSGSLDAGDALRGYNGAGVVEAGSAQMSMDAESGRWLNVRA